MIGYGLGETTVEEEAEIDAMELEDAMSQSISIPTVEQINLEHQLANSKAVEAVQHATNCGLMLLQVKASLNHGAWLPWLKQQQESGAIQVSQQTASKYMKLASNYNRERNLLEAPSIRAALELLSDREPEAHQAALIPVDVESERQAREAAEHIAETERRARLTAESRAQEFGKESNDRRKRIRELETQLDLLEKKPAPVSSPVTVEVPPADYEAFKARAVELAAELETVKQEQARIVQSAIKAKMQDHRREVADLEGQKTMLEDKTKRMMDYLASLSSEVNRIETHMEVIKGDRMELINLAAFLQDMEPMKDADTIAHWLALAQMHDEAANGIRQVFGPAKPALTVIQGNAL